MSTRILSVFSLLKRVGFAFLLWGGSEGAWADTTWVSGQVGGIWDISGSPYMVQGLCWVDPEQGLSVLSGSEVVLDNMGSRLTLTGRCSFIGSEADSVLLRLGTESSTLASVGDLTEAVLFAYTKVEGPGWLELRADSLTVEHSAFGPPDSLGSGGCAIDFVGMAFTARRSIFSSADIYNAYCDVGFCRYTKEFLTTFASGIVDSLEYVGRDSLSLGEISFRPSGQGALVEISSSSCRTLLLDGGFGSATRFNVANSTITEFATIWYSDSVSLINSYCNILRLFDASGVVKNNILRLVKVENAVDTCIIEKNTFLGNRCWSPNSEPIVELGRAGFVALSNNIFESRFTNQYVLGRHFGTISATPAYNLVYGMTDPWRGWAIGPGNIAGNPQFDPHDSGYSLTFQSPAIDSGDPSILDPDGTVSDIGASWWDHLYDHRPIITTPDTLFLRWGDSLNLSWTASDEGDVSVEVLGQLPDWISETHVPFGAESFTVNLIATDNVSQTDSETVVVQVYPYSVLPQTSRGILTQAYSPYFAPSDILVPADDTLQVESGVSIMFGSDACTPWLRVEGALIIHGQQDDSVTLQGIGPESWQGIALVGESSTLSAEFGIIKDATQGLDAQFSGGIEFQNCTMIGDSLTYPMLYIRHPADSIRIISCELLNGIQIVISNAQVLIDSSRFVGGQDFAQFSMTLGSAIVRNSVFDAIPDFAISLSDVESELERCLFSGGMAFACVVSNVYERDTVNTNIHHCIFQNTSGRAVAFGTGSAQNVNRAEVVNCVFDSAGESLLLLGQFVDSSTVHFGYNCVSNFSVAAQNSSGEQVWPTLAEFNGFNLNGDSIDIYYNVLSLPMLNEQFVPLPGSPCIDAGVDIGEFYYGSAPDIGIHEIQRQSAGSASDNVASKIQIYPNPVSSGSDLQVAFRNSQVVEIKVFNILGQRICTINCAGQTGEVTIPIIGTDFSTGMYFLEIDAPHAIERRRIVVIN